MNEAESNLYHSWPVYSPISSHEWQLEHEPGRIHETFSREFDHPANKISSDNLDFLQGLRRMEFEGLNKHDRAEPEVKAAKAIEKH